MRWLAWSLALLVAVSVGCTAQNAATGFRCVDCLSSSDCGGTQLCIQYAADVACAPACAPDGSCQSGYHCAAYASVAGEQVMACVPDVAACGMVGNDANDGIDAGTGGTCGGLVGPTSAACCACSAGHTCTANGCYGGWWCNAATCHCQTPPTTCPGTLPDAGPRDAGPLPDVGPLPMGTVGPTGGTVSSLFFSVLGDSRPSVETTGTVGYPTAVVAQLYQVLEAHSPRPQFVVVTGDYCFANPFGTGAHEQMALYLGARAAYSGTVFYAMGNHECTGGTSSNCGPGNANGVTRNYSAFVSDMLGPIGQRRPYYAFRVDSTSRAWTSKFIFAAPNAWDLAQQDFLTQQLAIPTTYTFVISHEPPTTTSGPPGLAPLNALIAANPVTLHMTGHSHTYYHQRGTNTVVIGLGGAPPSGRYNYGYLTVAQLANGDIEVAEFDYMTQARNDIFRLHPDGTAAP